MKVETVAARPRLLKIWIGHLVALLALVVCTACADNLTSATSATGVPSEINLVVTALNAAQPPTASIVATVRDEGSLPVNGLKVTFTTTSGFITTGTVTGGDGVAVGVLTGATGTSPTVTASVTVDTTTVTNSTIVHF